MIKPLDYDTLSKEQQKTYREIIALRERNAERVNKVESHGLTLDLGTARLEHFLNALIEFGILDIDQVLALDKAWELELRKQSKEILERVETQIAEARRERARPKLIIPGQ